MKINTQYNSGNFTLSLSAEVSEEMKEKLASLGLRYLAQRNTEHDKVLGGFETGKDGKVKRKAGWKRGDVGYDPVLAAKLAKSYLELSLPDSEEKIEVEPVVTEYIREAADSKFTEERAIASRKESKGSLEAWAAARGVTETHTEDGEDYSPELLRKIREVKLAAIRAAAAGI